MSTPVRRSGTAGGRPAIGSDQAEEWDDVDVLLDAPEWTLEAALTGIDVDAASGSHIVSVRFGVDGERLTEPGGPDPDGASRIRPVQHLH